MRNAGMYLIVLCAVAFAVTAQEEVPTDEVRRANVVAEEANKALVAPVVAQAGESEAQRAARETTERKAARAKARRANLDLMNKATDHMEKGTKALAAIEVFLVNQVSLTNATNPWNDVDLRNTYDEVKDWGTVAGSVVAAVAMLRQGDSDNRNSVGAVGVGLVGLSQAVGRLFGASNSNRLAEKAAFLDMTVRAYDDMLAYRKHLESLVKKNDDERGKRFAATRAEVLAVVAKPEAEVNDVTVLHLLERVQADSGEYESAIRELLSASDSLQSLAGGYLLALGDVHRDEPNDVEETFSSEAKAVSKRLSASEGVRKARYDLRQVVRGLAEFKEKRAPAVYEFFNVSSETSSNLKNAELALRQTQI